MALVGCGRPRSRRRARVFGRALFARLSLSLVLRDGGPRYPNLLADLEATELALAERCFAVRETLPPEPKDQKAREKWKAECDTIHDSLKLCHGLIPNARYQGLVTFPFICATDSTCGRNICVNDFYSAELF